ncbi:hypothetical protein [uncultured Succinatimonas sp.]|uniref:hypothetical protein n=1 Tax=uncultured Succinatimonas sp. TaxID=1262973 RepID=UPI0025CEB3CA|nr:hypothetical protein [uncultured Succinatimonas sp.]
MTSIIFSSSGWVPLSKMTAFNKSIRKTLCSRLERMCLAKASLVRFKETDGERRFCHDASFNKTKASLCLSAKADPVINTANYTQRFFKAHKSKKKIF